MTNEILNWPCKKCGKLNKWHEIFVEKMERGKYIFYGAQLKPKDAPYFIEQFDHYYELPSNLEFFEILYESRNH